jgi:uncharacterized membrane protein
VEVVARSPDGRWLRVGAGELSGWAAARFLTPVPGATPWWTLAAPLRCLGTEPFWTLALAPGAEAATLSTPDQPGLAMAATARWPGGGGPAVAGAAFEGAGAAAVVAMTGQACSDGMSDRDYAVAATLLLRGAGLGEGQPLIGCCTLAAP